MDMDMDMRDDEVRGWRGSYRGTDMRGANDIYHGDEGMTEDADCCPMCGIAENDPCELCLCGESEVGYAQSERS